MKLRFPGRSGSRPERRGVQHHITRVYLAQVALVSIATVLGVLATAMVIERVLIKQALLMEAEHFWELHEQNPHVARPDTRHLLGLLQGEHVSDSVPASLVDLPQGYHRAEVDGEQPLVYVEEHRGNRLYLIFDEQRVGVLALVFGILPLTGVLLVIYVLAFLGWRKSRALISPLVQLAEVIRSTPVNEPRAARPDLSSIEAETDSEVAVLVDALNAYADNLVQFVERERQFTRDASHELRTPLAVIRANLELLASRLPDAPQLRRIEDTVGDMEAVIETLLMLARTENSALPEEHLMVNDLASNLAERLMPLAERKGVELAVRQNALLELEVSEAVLTIVLTNLIRNAINYTASGSVEVIINQHDVVVQDTGPGIEPADLERLMRPFERGESSEGGHGLGLAIVQRLCERGRWQLDVASKPGQGTRVRVRFSRRLLPF